MYNNGILNMNNILNIEAITTNINYNILFNNEILDNIMNEKAIAICNTSFKANQLRGYWRRSSSRKTNDISYLTCSKN